jgi:cyclophilin family peptidyl-prolyl cis-trans isomerase
MSKRRRGSRQAPPRRHGGNPTAPVKGKTRATVPGLPWLTVGGAAVVVVVIAMLVLGSGAFFAAGSTASPSAPAADASVAATAGASNAGAGGSPVVVADCPTSQPDPLPAGETRTVSLDTEKGTIVIGVQADLSPIAAGNFVALAACGFYDGTPFHRTATLQDGTPFVIQGGDPTGTGTGGPGYEIKDEPVTTAYKRGTVAMARSSAPNSVGSQYFIVLDDKDGAVLSSANTYQIIGSVTSGMDVADAIYAASGGQELPANPVKVTTATVTNP